ncbi:MAG: hypothetical protein V7723_07480 [Sneathiella sp.]|uniref:hypothetical protein n=1 Tax=Sneathiella sp. TaxID=1964365 RepID=UPI003003773A
MTTKNTKQINSMIIADLFDVTHFEILKNIKKLHPGGGLSQGISIKPTNDNYNSYLVSSTAFHDLCDLMSNTNEVAKRFSFRRPNIDGYPVAPESYDSKNIAKFLNIEHLSLFPILKAVTDHSLSGKPSEGPFKCMPGAPHKGYQGHWNISPAVFDLVVNYLSDTNKIAADYAHATEQATIELKRKGMSVPEYAEGDMEENYFVPDVDPEILADLNLECMQELHLINHALYFNDGGSITRDTVLDEGGKNVGTPVQLLQRVSDKLGHMQHALRGTQADYWDDDEFVEVNENY